MRDTLAGWIEAERTGADIGAAALALVESAEAALRATAAGVAPADWHAYLDTTARPSFLEALPGPAARSRWADTTFAAIRRSGYTLGTLLAQRVARHPDRMLFEDAREGETPSWTYAQVARYTRTLAAVFLASVPAGPDRPRVAIYAENSIDSACADLACLLHGLLVAPLNVHTDVDTLAWMFDRLAVDTVVTDSDERTARLAAVRARTGRPLRVFRTGERASAGGVAGLDVSPLRHACARVDLSRADAALAARPVDLTAAATVMFTSGSTGQPKGVVFSQYSLLAKRFARHAALPSVGRDEVLLCYLPLFHTFGRYLELLGTIYWGGTYVFAGSPSADALIAELGRVRPTGLVSIPARWAQIREHCLEAMDREPGAAHEGTQVRQVVGDRLRWGLSAAGFLDPKVFRFFQRHGVDLCSGFGMTEATGGITMTPPGAYVDGTVGLPLPGVKVRLGDRGELQMSGPYVVRYLDDEGTPGVVPPIDPDEEHWVATGDLFVEHPNGYLEIVDRIKDIYKNSRGQTVAPQRVEQRLASVPGIRRGFLVGDHRDHNVLLIVPDRDDAVLAGRADEQVSEYLGQIVASVNAGLAPYERVVRFAVLPRDFDLALDELTPKGTYRRKVIEQHFADVIEGLYRTNYVDLEVAGLRLRIPRWFFRDLAVLEDDIAAGRGGLHNRRTGRRLAVARCRDGRVRIGDLAYQVDGDTVDLGLFARQPRLWLGNPSLAAFAPCKPGWDAPLRQVSGQVRLPRATRGPGETQPTQPGDDELGAAHRGCAVALFGGAADAAAAVEDLAHQLARADARLGSVIRRRLEALAWRPEADLRARAYRILLLDEPSFDYDTAFPAFVESGLSFLDEANIAAIAEARHGERRLQALRQRLFSYRTCLAWPGPRARHGQFTSVFKLLADFARRHPEYFPAVQAELACWALFRDHRGLARAAAAHLEALSGWYEATLKRDAAGAPPSVLEGRLVVEAGIPESEQSALRAVLADATFLRRSLAHACGEDRFAWDQVAPGGVWVSPVLSHHPARVYRLGINLIGGKHFDLLLVMGPGMRTAGARDTVRWFTALSCHPLGTPALPRFGAWRKDLGAIAVAYVSDLTAWERIRELASQHDVRDGSARAWAWKKLFVRAMAAFFRGWAQSGFRIVPGAVTPANVALSDADFHEHASLLSLSGWCDYDGPLALIERLARGFYHLTDAHYPQSRGILQLAWIFDACFEGLGGDEAGRFLLDLDRELAEAPPSAATTALQEALAAHLAGLRNHLHIPLPVLCAIERFRDWERSNPDAGVEAREEAVIQMIHLYRLERYPDAFRYLVYQRTYFARAERAVHDAFDRAIAARLAADPVRRGSLEGLGDLQARLSGQDDRDVFSRMVFPHARRSQRLEIAAIGRHDESRVIVRSAIADDAGATYSVSEPPGPAELGHLYRLILDTDYPKHIREQDRHLIVTDAEERVVGGLCYRWQEPGVVYVDGIVVAGPLTNQGIGGRLVEDLCVRVAAQGAWCVKTNFFLGRLFAKHGFQVNQRWGGLVRFLSVSDAGPGTADQTPPPSTL